MRLIDAHLKRLHLSTENKNKTQINASFNNGDYLQIRHINLRRLSHYAKLTTGFEKPNL